MKRFNKRKLVSLCLVLAMQDGYAAPPSGPSVSPETTQTIQSLSNFFDAGRVTNQVQQSMPQQTKPKLKPVLRPEEEKEAQAAKIHFKFNTAIITGNTVFSSRELRKIFQSAEGKEISLVKLQSMVRAVTLKYRDAGYILSRAILPPQVIKDGIVHIRVVEGFISSVSVKADTRNLNKLLAGYGARVKASRPLQIQKLERYSLLANDLPGVSVQSVLTPSKNVPAGADLTLVETKKFGSAFISYDNFGTRYIGPDELSFGASVYSLIVPGDSNNVRFSVTSNPNELHYTEFTHTEPLGTDGLRWKLGANYAQTRPDFVLKPLFVVGRTALFYTDFSYPILRDRSKNFVVHATANYQNVTSTLLGTPFYQDRLRTVVVGAVLDIIDGWRGVNNVGLDVTHGFDLWGAHTHLNQSRPLAQTVYTRFNLTMSRLQSINSRFSLYGALHGQYTQAPLLATEQFGVGGPDIGRGYDPSEIVGDRGFSAKLELRLDTFPGFSFLNAIEYYVFYDGGMVWNIDTLNLIPRQSLTSMGAGARFTFLPQVSGNFYVAKPLTLPVSVLSALNHNAYQARTYFQVTASM